MFKLQRQRLAIETKIRRQGKKLRDIEKINIQRERLKYKEKD